MKKAFATLLAISVISFSALAQEKREIKHPGGHPMMHHPGKMLRELNLTAEQKKQLKVNRELFKQKMQELNKNEDITVKEFRDRKAVLMKEQKAKMEALLTSEQKNKLEMLKTQQKMKKDEHFARHLDKMKTELGLNEDQVAKLKAQKESMQSRMKAIKENESLSRSQKKDQMMTLKKEAKEQHEKIFTQDQLKKLELMKQKHFENNPVNSNKTPQ
jgi:Spy/CpxP family protein refolding chaperone